MKSTLHAEALLRILKQHDPSFMPEEIDAIEMEARRRGLSAVTPDCIRGTLILTDKMFGRGRYEAAQQHLRRQIERAKTASQQHGGSDE